VILAAPTVRLGRPRRLPLACATEQSSIDDGTLEFAPIPDPVPSHGGESGEDGPLAGFLALALDVGADYLELLIVDQAQRRCTCGEPKGDQQDVIRVCSSSSQERAIAI